MAWTLRKVSNAALILACVFSNRRILVSISEQRLAGSLLSSAEDSAGALLEVGPCCCCCCCNCCGGGGCWRLTAGVFFVEGDGDCIGGISLFSALRLERMDSAWLMELSALAMILRKDSSRLLASSPPPELPFRKSSSSCPLRAAALLPCLPMAGALYFLAGGAAPHAALLPAYSALSMSSLSADSDLPYLLAPDEADAGLRCRLNLPPPLPPLGREKAAPDAKLTSVEGEMVTPPPREDVMTTSPCCCCCCCEETSPAWKSGW